MSVSRALAVVRSRFPEPGPAGLVEGAAITVSFHPDRLVRDGRTVVQCLAARCGTLRWSPGFSLSLAEFPAGLRGPEIPPLAEEIAARYGVGALDAEVIGRAPGAPLRLIKYLWHILVVLGRPAC